MNQDKSSAKKTTQKPARRTTNSDKAKLNEGDFWPVAFALHELIPSVEAKIVALVKKALS
jgi:hypothetical protein